LKNRPDIRISTELISEKDGNGKVELHKLTIHEARDLLRKREISSRELTESVIDHIGSTEKNIRAFISTDFGGALKQADKADSMFAAGEPMPDTAGIPFGLKDNICTKGILTTCGSNILKNFIPSYDSEAARRLKGGFGVLLGKLNMDEFAIGSSGETSIFSHTRNPWGLQRVPGGSSGGSAAAVAADEVFFALGSDTGGSIRQPASFCSVVGLKPTFGSVSSYGMVPFAASLDQLGPLTKDVTDCAIIMNTIAGYDAKDSASAKADYPDYTSFLKDDVDGLRIAVPRDWFLKVRNNEVRTAVENAIRMLERMGAVVAEVSLPHLEYAVPAYFLISAAEVSSMISDFHSILSGTRLDDLHSEEASPYGTGDLSSTAELLNGVDILPDTAEMKDGAGISDIGPSVKKRVLLGAYALSGSNFEKYYLKALKVRTLIKQDYDKIFQKYDLVLSPTSTNTAFRFKELHDNIVEMYEYDIFTVLVNLAGLPAISIPCGFDERNLPIGLQLTGKPFGEGTLFRAAYTFEQNTDYHLKTPFIGR
jgi:aspartyl-tRNA(Asn)/glutamyl-tRNA(Gln) amidotransferase subunit A